MEDFKFQVGDYVIFNKPSRWDGLHFINALHDRVFLISRRFIDDGYKEYDLGNFHVEEQSISLALTRDETPDYAKGDIVVLERSDENIYENWVGEECEVIDTTRLQDVNKPEMVKLKLKDHPDNSGTWFYPPEIRYQKIEIEPITGEEVIDILNSHESI